MIRPTGIDGVEPQGPGFELPGMPGEGALLDEFRSRVLSTLHNDVETHLKRHQICNVHHIPYLSVLH